VISVVVQVFRFQAQATELTRQSMQGTPEVYFWIDVSHVFAVTPHMKGNLSYHNKNSSDSREKEKRRNQKQSMTGLVVAENNFLKRKNVLELWHCVK
jgi:hypothetical protein